MLKHSVVILIRDIDNKDTNNGHRDVTTSIRTIRKQLSLTATETDNNIDKDK